METIRYVSPDTGARLILLEDNTIRTIPLESKTVWSFGRTDHARNITPDINVRAPIVSRNHGSFMKLDGRWVFICNAAKNSTFFNGQLIQQSPDGRANPILLKNGDMIRVDSPDLNNPDRRGIVLLFSTSDIKGEWTSYSLQFSPEVYIGRNAENHIMLPQPYISKRHAKIEHINGRYYLSDCRSSAGTWLNGQPVMSRMELREKDKIAICDTILFFTGESLIYNQRELTRAQDRRSPIPQREKRVLLEAHIKTKKVKNRSGSGKKELIKDVNLTVKEGSLVALLGMSGAGKTTIMNCLNGMDTQGVEGSILFMGDDLMRNFEQYKCLIGSVPQENIFQSVNTPEQEFSFAAKLRLPPDTTKGEIRQRVDETIRILGLEGVRKSRNSKLSGGEKKRVNIGKELVADRLLICLDEPDAGLDPLSKHDLFSILHDLAHINGKCVMVIIHDVSEIDMFDQIIMMAKAQGTGRLAFSGSPEEAKRYFGADIRTAYSLLRENPEKYIMR